MKKIIVTVAFFIGLGQTFAYAGAVEDLLSRYRAKGAKNFSVENGQAMWVTTYEDAKTGMTRSCEICHKKNLKAKGEHQKTGEVIEPLAPSVNPVRFTDVKFIEKWFKRNCKWTIGRECTSQEKGDFLLFLQTQ
ncbi:hypothetical protein MNBD_NITROSPINAE01-840 [hydrothermal vent metagenome]|uniref:Cytochrome c domain-containing protein n=1 Tax=hydrothermal vent metagenome TaxID=652676 RepID=A0A3B1BXM3_9ZZZZ